MKRNRKRKEGKGNLRNLKRDISRERRLSPRRNRLSQKGTKEKIHPLKEIMEKIQLTHSLRRKKQNIQCKKRKKGKIKKMKKREMC
jgi:hypothetical protein